MDTRTIKVTDQGIFSEKTYISASGEIGHKTTWAGPDAITLQVPELFVVFMDLIALAIRCRDEALVLEGYLDGFEVARVWYEDGTWRFGHINPVTNTVYYDHVPFDDPQALAVWMMFRGTDESYWEIKSDE